MKKLIHISMLCFCMAFSVFTYAQDNATTSIGQYSAKLAHSGYDTVAQSFLLEEEAFIESFRLVVFSRYNVADHPGVLSVIEGDGPYGDIVFQVPVLVKTLNKFFEEETLQNLTSTEIEYLWGDLQSSIDSEETVFEDMATTFPIGRQLPSGEYTVMVSLDTSVTSSSGLRWITSFTNCYSWPCSSPYNVDPYPNGTHYSGLDMMLLQNDARDMAFEVKLRQDVTTAISEQDEKLSLTISDGELVVPNDWAGGSLLVTDVLGREHASLSVLYGKERVSLPKDQVAIVSVLFQDGERRTAKVFTGI